MPDLPMTRQSLASACDMQLPSMLRDEHLAYLAAAIRLALYETEGDD
jgi:hypothetical protein